MKSKIVGSVLISVIGFALAMGPALSEELEVKNMDRLNSSASDFAPMVSPDGQILFFTSDRPGGNGGQDIWMSRMKDGRWSSPENLGAPVNDRFNQGLDCYVKEGDKEYIYLTNCSNSELGLCDIYVSEKQDNGRWGKPKNLGAPINTEYSEANASWDYTNNILYFVSTRPGGMVGEGPKKLPGESSYDLWMCERKTDGKWGEPKALGAPINTPGWEGVAFIHAAEQTLYFSSDGHGGQGGADLFKSARRSDGSFGEPEAVEFVNTAGNDMYLSIPAMGDVAYLSSNVMGGKGQEDIYRVPLSVILSPEALAIRSLKLPVATAVSRLGAALLETIYFRFDRDVLGAAETAKLDKAIQFMNDNPKVRLQISGHADSLGDADYNLMLSRRRAQAVEKYLRDKGIPADRLRIVFFGEEKPAKANDPKQGNPLNRRVELSILQ